MRLNQRSCNEIMQWGLFHCKGPSKEEAGGSETRGAMTEAEVRGEKMQEGVLSQGRQAALFCKQKVVPQPLRDVMRCHFRAHGQPGLLPLPASGSRKVTEHLRGSRRRQHHGEPPTRCCGLTPPGPGVTQLRTWPVHHVAVPLLTRGRVQTFLNIPSATPNCLRVTDRETEAGPQGCAW